MPFVICDAISFFLMWKCQNIKNKLFIYIPNYLKNLITRALLSLKNDP